MNLSVESVASYWDELEKLARATPVFTPWTPKGGVSYRLNKKINKALAPTWSPKVGLEKLSSKKSWMSNLDWEKLENTQKKLRQPLPDLSDPKVAERARALLREQNKDVGGTGEAEFLKWTKTKTAMAVQDMQRGDIIVASPGPTHERASAGHKFQDWLFTKASPYWQGLFTHAGIYVGDGKTIEAYPKGIIKRPVGKLLKNRSYVVVRPKATKAQREHAARFAESQLGKPYSKVDLLRASLRTMLPASAATLVGGAPGIPDKKNAKGYQCGGLVAASYAAAKAPLNSKINAKYTPPNELILGERSQVVGRLMRKGHKLNAPMGRAMRAPWLKKMKEFDILRGDRRREKRELKKVAQPVGRAYPGTQFSQSKVTPGLTRTNEEAMRLAAKQAGIPKKLRKTHRGSLYGALLALKRGK